MAKIVGFIGSGNMGRAIMGGMIAAGLYAPSQILASARTKETVEKIEKELGVVATTDNAAVAKKADILFLAVKPGVFATVIPEIRDCCKEGQIVVSIAAGQKLTSITEMFGQYAGTCWRSNECSDTKQSSWRRRNTGSDGNF